MKIILDNRDENEKKFITCGFTLYNEFNSEWENMSSSAITNEIISDISKIDDIDTLKVYYGADCYEIYTFIYDNEEYSFHNPSRFEVDGGFLRVDCSTLDGCYSNLFIANKVSRIEHHFLANPTLEDAYKKRYSELSKKKSKQNDNIENS